MDPQLVMARFNRTATPSGEAWASEAATVSSTLDGSALDCSCVASVGASVGGGQSSSAASTTSSFRSLTVITKFNADKTVKDYSVRASQF